ncbi:PQQ-dependent sugar dehydrogenase [Halorubrum vacuolatum]
MTTDPNVTAGSPTRRRFLRETAIVGGTVAVVGCLDDTPEGTADDAAADDDDGPDDRDGPYAVERVAEGLDRVWGLAFLPADGRLLATERDGDLRLIDPGDATNDDAVDGPDADEGPPVVSGTPDVLAAGQGGLLDVTTHPEYPDEPFVYLTYVAANADGESTTHLGRGRLDPDAPALAGFEALHAAEPFLGSSQHFGSRVVFGADGMAYVTVGDRGSKDFGPDHYSQDPSNELGAILRLEPDGSIPEDNPFVDDADVADSIYAYGLRNTQGLARHPETDALWASEHGERDGDSITIVERGGNHGWPIAHYGCEYGSDDPVGDRPDERDDVVDPVYYWECGSGGFPPAGMTIYDGDAFPDWAGDLFVGNLAGTYLGHFTIDDPAADRPVVEEVDPLLEAEGWRVRDVAIGPDDGALYVALDETNAPLVRVVPS